MKRSSSKSIVLALSVVSLLAFSLIAGSLVGHSSYEEEDPIFQSPPGEKEPGPPDDLPDPGERGRKLGRSLISFNTTDTGISNYSFGLEEEIQIFEEIAVDDFDKEEERERGVRHEIDGNDADFRIHDNPAGLLKLNVEGEGRNLSFSLGDMEIEEATERWINMRHGNFSARLMLVAGTNETVLGPELDENILNYTVQDEARFLFRIGRKDLAQIGLGEFVEAGISEGNIGAEFRIEKSQESNYVKNEVSYRDVNLMAEMEDENKLGLEVSSDTLGDEGTIMLVDVSSTVMDVEDEEDIGINFDGEPAKQIDEPEKLIDMDEAAYSIIIGEEDSFILFRVPHFSTHTIMIEHVTETIEEVLGSLQYYLSTAGITAGLAFIGVLYKKYDKKIKESGLKDYKKEKDDGDKDQKKKNRDVVSIDGTSEQYEKNLGKGSEKRIKSGKKDEKKGIKVRKN